ncbi:MAG: hypothetical protein AB8I08_39655 [Sandaracinaceae bacterium]
MRFSLLLCLLVLAIATGCEDDRVATDGSVPTDAPAMDAAVEDAGAADAGPDAGRAMDAAAPEGLSVVFDYRYDTAGFFSDPSRRAALEAAAAVWSTLLTDDFEDIPAGTTIRTRDPENPTAAATNFPSDDVIDDVLIFVGCARFDGGLAQSNHAAALSSVADVALANRLRARSQGADFQPWTGWISFNCDTPWFFDDTLETDSDIPGGQNDFHSTAMHEIAHVLGFGTSNAFSDQVSGGAFTGPTAVESFGGPVPLTSSGVHFQSSVVSGGNVTLMDISRTIGTRTLPTPVDIAVMADLGYAL